MVPVFFSFLLYYNHNHLFFRPWAIILFLIAILTDAADGFIARSFKKQTELGTFLDPLADKLLLLSGFFGIAFSSAFAIKPPMWVIVVIVFRDLFIICGLVIIFVTTRQLRIQPNLLGKLTTFFQMLTILVVLMGWEHSSLIWFATVGLTVVSAFAYLIRGIRLINGLQ